MRVVERWFEHETVDDGVLRIREPYVDPFLQANLFLIRGRDRLLGLIERYVRTRA